MNAPRILVLLAAVNLISGCALLNTLTGGHAGDVEAGLRAAGGEAAQIIQEATARAKARCEPIRTAEVSWPEERALGGVVSIKQVSTHGHLALEGLTATDPVALARDVTDKKKVTLPDSPKNDLTAYVSIVGRNLAKYSTRPEIAWTFAVIENDTPNAFSAPGGYVVVTSGLLRKMTNEAQLAGVLAHEIGHVVLKHSLKRYRSAKADQCSVAVAGGYVIGKGLQAAISMLPAETREAAQFANEFENFDMDAPNKGKLVVFVMDAVMAVIEAKGNEQEDEFQADATALELVSFAGYEASEYEKFLSWLGSGGGGFSKHPSTRDRVAKLKALREGEMAPFATGTAKPDTSKVFAPISKQ